MKQATLRTLLAISLLVLLGGNVHAADQPLKIYIMAGQSNMVGYGAVTSFDYIGDDPKTAPLLKLMRGDDGKPAVGKRVWISSFTGKMNQQAHEYVGKLRVGLGGRRDHSKLGNCIGPEYPFGLVMEQAYDGPILIIKTAWGGQSLCVHYRSPSAGPYEPLDSEKAVWAKSNTTQSKLAQIKKETGQNYRWMMDHVKKVLADIKRVYPDYDEQQGYELAGFVWFQGWNDYISGHYPESLGKNRYAEYTKLLAHFIRDVRKDLNAPKMPFTIGVVGFYGNFTPSVFADKKGLTKPRMKVFRKAQAAVAALPEFKGSVAAVQTAPFWDDKLMAIALKQIKYFQMKNRLTKKRKEGPNADGKMTKQQIAEYMEKYRKEILTAEDEALHKRGGGGGGWGHYHGSAKFHAQAGKAFAEALIGSEKK